MYKLPNEEYAEYCKRLMKNLTKQYSLLNSSFPDNLY